MPQDKDELLQVLITKYAQMYMKLAYAIGVPYDDVEDIVMEAFWSFYRADYGGKLESEKAIKVMLARIVENKCIDYFRKEKRSIKPNEDEDVSELEYVADLSTYDPLQSVISRESCGQIFEVLDGLRESWKDVTALFEELLKKSVKSILGRYLCGRNNPKITHRFLCECYKINNYNLGM